MCMGGVIVGYLAGGKAEVGKCPVAKTIRVVDSKEDVFLSSDRDLSGEVGHS